MTISNTGQQKPSSQFNARLPHLTHTQITDLSEAYGLTKTQAIILAVDRILDMFRTTINVLSDSCGAVIVARLEGEKLKVIGESPQ